MKILVALPRFPWPIDKGDRLRAYKQIEGLAAGHEIHLVCLNDEPVSPEGYAAVKKYCKSIEVIQQGKLGIALHLLSGLFNRLPFQVNYFTSSKARKIISDTINREKPDVIFVQLVRMNENIPDSTVPMLLDFQDAFSAGMEKRIALSSFFERPWVRKEARRLRDYENEVAARYKKCIIISGQDRENLGDSAKVKTLVIPNGVNQSFLEFDSRGTNKEYDLLFTGNMGYHPNIKAAVYLVKKILPQLREKGYEAKICIAGARPDAEVKELEGPGVSVFGPVDDLRPLFAKSKLFVAPMISGSGLQNKLLESMAMGLPTLTTPISNAALGAKPGEEILVCGNENEFAENIIALLRDPEKASKIAAGGKDFVLSNYDWKEINKRLEAILLDISGLK